MNPAHRSPLLLLSLLAALPLAAGADPAPPAPGRGEVVLQLDFAAEAERDRWSRAAEARWTPEGPDGRTCLRVEIAGDQPGTRMVARPVDLTPFRGMTLAFAGRVRAEGVTQPPQAYNGVKLMLHYRAGSGEHWNNQNGVFGTFGWKTIGFTSPIPEDAGMGELCLGLQDSAGSAWFSDVTATVLRPRLPPRPAPDPRAPPAYRGHTLPRLRGVMSPNTFREEDLRVLGAEWKANLIRWQLTRNWGKSGTERDLDEYDRWLGGKLDELALALDACRRYGLLAVIDLHTPPGGRDERMDMAMFYEPKYQDHFVKTWERIARRFKDHPAVWAYDLVNEPVCSMPTAPGMDSLATQVRAARAVRRIDPDRTIIIESESWDAPEAFAWLTPVDLPHIVYQVHLYVPHAYTHQGVTGPPTGVAYPGRIGGVLYDREALRKALQPVRAFQQAYNVHIYAGEFSAVRWAPGAARYLEDCISLFEEYGWDWSYHAFREWPGWSVEHENLPADRAVHHPATTETDRQQVLRRWFGQNEQPR